MKAPAFQLYAADFYMDTLTWETDDIGVYFCLLMAEWVNGPLEDDTRKLAKIAKKTHQKFIKNFSKISHKFSVNSDGKLVNLRLEEERERQNQFHNSRKSGGIKTASKRWGNRKDDSSAISSANSSANSSRVGLLSSSSSSIKDKTIKAEAAGLPLEIPSKEIISEAAIPKIENDIQAVCEKLYEEKKFPAVFAFKNAAIKQQKNVRAVLHTLSRCYISDPKDPWAFCAKILQMESMNYNARDHQKTS